MTPDAVGGRSVMRSLQLSGKFIAEDGTHEHNYNLGSHARFWGESL